MMKLIAKLNCTLNYFVQFDLTNILSALKDLFLGQHVLEYINGFGFQRIVEQYCAALIHDNCFLGHRVRFHL